jgi:ABC-type uncharacterized transport system auxiliary subunit
VTRCAPLLAIAALLLALCGCGEHRPASATPRTITDLHDISQLRTAFAKASGEPRLVVIVSPT